MNEKLGYRKTSNVIEYILIITLFYVTGGAFSYTNYSMQITVFFLAALAICNIMGKQCYTLRRSAFVVWLVMSLFVIFVPLMFNDSLPTYIAIIMQLGIGLFCASIIEPEDFKKKYIDIIVLFAGISLVGFGIGIIYPQIAFFFPETIGDASVDYYNAGVYVFMKAKGYSDLVLTSRNAGICWEPGCYQMFLNVALLFILDAESVERGRKYYFSLLILIITIITTMSTTGLILMLIILVCYWKKWFPDKYVWFLLIPILSVCVIIFTGMVDLHGFILSKISQEFGENLGFLERLSLPAIKYIISDNGIFYFLGMSFSKWLTYDVSLWNSVIHSILCLGIPFTAIHLRGYWMGSHLVVNRGLLLFIVMLCCASTETLFWRVFFNTIAFYGWIGERDGLKFNKIGEGVI